MDAGDQSQVITLAGKAPNLLSHLAGPNKATFSRSVNLQLPPKEVFYPMETEPERLSHSRVNDWLSALEHFFSGPGLEAWVGHGMTFISPLGKKVTDHSILGLSLPDSRLARRQWCCPKPRASGCSQHCAGKYRRSVVRCGTSPSAPFWVSRATTSPQLPLAPRRWLKWAAVSKSNAAK